jgi:hypothetical protein
MTILEIISNWIKMSSSVDVKKASTHPDGVFIIPTQHKNEDLNAENCSILPFSDRGIDAIMNNSSGNVLGFVVNREIWGSEQKDLDSAVKFIKNRSAQHGNMSRMMFSVDNYSFVDSESLYDVFGDRLEKIKSKDPNPIVVKLMLYKTGQVATPMMGRKVYWSDELIHQHNEFRGTPIYLGHTSMFDTFKMPSGTIVKTMVDYEEKGAVGYAYIFNTQSDTDSIRFREILEMKEVLGDDLPISDVSTEIAVTKFGQQREDGSYPIVKFTGLATAFVYKKLAAVKGSRTLGVINNIGNIDNEDEMNEEEVKKLISDSFDEFTKKLPEIVKSSIPAQVSATDIIQSDDFKNSIGEIVSSAMSKVEDRKVKDVEVIGKVAKDMGMEVSPEFAEVIASKLRRNSGISGEFTEETIKPQLSFISDIIQNASQSGIINNPDENQPSNTSTPAVSAGSSVGQSLFYSTEKKED